MKILGVTALARFLLGCVATSMQSRESGAMRLDYRVTVFRTDTGAVVRVEHDFVNTSDRTISLCTLPERVNYEWTAESADGTSPVGGCTMGGRIGCVETSQHFAAIPAGESIQFCVEAFTVPTTSSWLTYHASVSAFRDGSHLGVRSWTNRVEGSRITIPMN